MSFGHKADALTTGYLEPRFPYACHSGKKAGVVVKMFDLVLTLGSTCHLAWRFVPLVVLLEEVYHWAFVQHLMSNSGLSVAIRHS